MSTNIHATIIMPAIEDIVYCIAIFTDYASLSGDAIQSLNWTIENTPYIKMFIVNNKDTPGHIPCEFFHIQTVMNYTRIRAVYLVGSFNKPSSLNNLYGIFGETFWISHNWCRIGVVVTAEVKDTNLNVDDMKKVILDVLAQKVVEYMHGEVSIYNIPDILKLKDQDLRDALQPKLDEKYQQNGVTIVHICVPFISGAPNLYS